jgi:ABC-2 type transport system permease protein
MPTAHSRDNTQVSPLFTHPYNTSVIVQRPDGMNKRWWGGYDVNGNAIVSPIELGVIHPAPSLLSSPYRFYRNIVDNKSMITNFIRRDVRIRYRNSLLGYVWTVLQPLLLAGVYYFVFTIIAGQEEELYPIWVLIGVITWQFFARSLNGSITSISRNSNMIKLIYFPREIFAITTVGSNAVITVLSLFVVIPFIFYYDLPVGVHFLWLLAGLSISAVMALGLGLMLAPLNAIHGDIAHLFQFITKAGFFLSPVMWTLRMIPASRGEMLDYILLNPMVIPLEMMRCGVDGSEFQIEGVWVVYSIGFAMASLLLGVIIFIQTEWRAVKYI